VIVYGAFSNAPVAQGDSHLLYKTLSKIEKPGCLAPFMELHTRFFFIF